MSKTAYVVSTDGKAVRLRKTPATDGSYNTIAKINPGTVVDVQEQAGEWATVVTPDGQRGYMMTQYLKFLEYADDEIQQPDGADMPEEITPEPETEDEVIAIALPKSAALGLYRALMKAVDG